LIIVKKGDVMDIGTRDEWFHKIEEVVRSRHYTWLAEGLGGKPVEEAMATLIADIHHVCQYSRVPWGHVMADGRELFEREEAACAVRHQDHESVKPPDLKSSEVERGLSV
jgi:hypothetical protein